MSDCIFCKIATGQIKANVVLNNERVMAFWDLNPQAPVHILIIPKKHIERLSAMSEDDLSLTLDIHKAALAIAKQEKIADSGFRLVTNNGNDAGQSVNHLHYHVLGGRHLTWPPG